MNPFVVPTKFRAVDEQTSTVRGMAMNVKDAFGIMSASVERQDRLFRKLTPSLNGITKQILSYATAGSLLAGIGWSGKSIMDYETSVQSLSAVTGVAGNDLVHFKDEIQDVATIAKKSATEVAGSFEVVGSMMSQYLKDPKALRQITEAGITLSKASRQELVPTLEDLTSIMNQFDLKAGQALYTVNKLTAGEIVGSLRTQQVAESMQEFGAGAFAANIHLDESVALVEALAKQLKTDKIGVGARNILTVLDSATGLAKKARKELKHAGVDMHFLMDKTKTLSERLHELSKVQNNQKAITKIFGRENKTAAQVIFNQLGVYDDYLEQIRKTNAAETQASINSQTLATSVDQLKNTWINYIATGDAATDGLNKAKDAVHFLTDNMDTIVSVGIDAIKIWAAWKGAIMAHQAVLATYNATLFVTNAYTKFMALSRMAATIEGITTATAAWQIMQEKLNAALFANPIGMTVTAVLALGAGIWYASKRTRELSEAYREKAALEADREINRETEAVRKLVSEYYNLGKGIRSATADAIKMRIATNEAKRHDIEKRIGTTKSELEKEKGKLYFRDLLYGGGAPMVGKRGELAEQLEVLQRLAKNLAADKVSDLLFAKSQVERGVINPGDVRGIFGNGGRGKGPTQAEEPSFWADQFAMQRDRNSTLFGDEKPAADKDRKFAFDYDMLKAAFSAALKDQKQPVVTVEGIRVGGSNSGLSQPGSY